MDFPGLGWSGLTRKERYCLDGENLRFWPWCNDCSLSIYWGNNWAKKLSAKAFCPSVMLTVSSMEYWGWTLSECNIREGLGADCGHGMMIPLESYERTKDKTQDLRSHGSDGVYRFFVFFCCNFSKSRRSFGLPLAFLFFIRFSKSIKSTSTPSNSSTIRVR